MHRDVMRMLTVAGVCLLLAGCVLQSEKPVYAEAEGKLVLKPLGSVFSAESYSNGAWKTEEGNLTFTVQGNHYVVNNSKDANTAEALFADAGNGFAMMQFGEAEKPSTYVIAEVQKGAVLLRPVMCSDLKKAHVTSTVLTFTDNDCKLTGKPSAADVKAWAAALGPAGMRMVPKT